LAGWEGCGHFPKTILLVALVGLPPAELLL
jgi:hypothetical protein